MNVNTEREIEEYVKNQNDERRRKGLEETLKNLNKTIDRTNKMLASFAPTPGKK